MSAVGLSLFGEEIASDVSQLDTLEAIRTVEDYKPLDIECALMGLALMPASTIFSATIRLRPNCRAL